MSAFVISHQTMQNVVAAFVAIADMPKDEATRLGKTMYTMNQSAVAARYGADDVMTTEAIEIRREFRWNERELDLNDRAAFIQAIKSMHCLRYQASEGDVPDMLAYKTLSSVIELAEAEYATRYATELDRKAAHALKRRLDVTQLMGGWYNRASWG